MTVSAPYYGENTVMRTPPPDLPSLLLKERIVYLGLPLFSDDDAKRQLGMDVTELIIAQLLYLEFEDPEKPIYFYINSTGTSWYTGDAVGFETEAFAICDTISYIKPPVHTICIGQAMGTAAVKELKVMNLSDLVIALRPEVQPGESLNIKIVREGKEKMQGIGYLDDGTMVVIDEAKNFVGSRLDIVITGALQTPTGRMVFGKLINNPESIKSFKSPATQG